MDQDDGEVSPKIPQTLIFFTKFIVRRNKRHDKYADVSQGSKSTKNHEHHLAQPD